MKSVHGACHSCSEPDSLPPTALRIKPNPQGVPHGPAWPGPCSSLNCLFNHHPPHFLWPNQAAFLLFSQPGWEWPSLPRCLHSLQPLPIMKPQFSVHPPPSPYPLVYFLCSPCHCPPVTILVCFLDCCLFPPPPAQQWIVNPVETSTWFCSFVQLASPPPAWCFVHSRLSINISGINV